jgi:hypothetical protein
MNAILFKIIQSISLGCWLDNKLSVSIVFWVNPLFLISFAKAVGNFVGGSNEIIHHSVVGWVFL